MQRSVNLHRFSMVIRTTPRRIS